jgi:hypothetical protein
MSKASNSMKNAGRGLDRRNLCYPQISGQEHGCERKRSSISLHCTYSSSENELRQYKLDLIKEGPEAWGDRDLYEDLMKAVNDCIERSSIREH